MRLRAWEAGDRNLLLLDGRSKKRSSIRSVECSSKGTEGARRKRGGPLAKYGVTPLSKGESLSNKKLGRSTIHK